MRKTDQTPIYADMSKAVKNSKMHDIDSSFVYQVENFVTYSSNEKITMVKYLCVQITKKNELNGELKTKINVLNTKISYQKMLSQH